MNKIFEQSKGKWTLPIPEYKQAVDNNLSLPYSSEGISFYTDSPYFVRAVYAGLVDTITITSENSWEIVVRFGDYKMIYGNIINVDVNKGDSLQEGQIVGRIFKIPEGTYELLLILKKHSKSIPVLTWFNWRRNGAKLKSLPSQGSCKLH